MSPLSIDELQQMRITGIMVNYYYVCKRKLWLFSKNISFEHNSDRVLLGKVLHESSFSWIGRKEVLIDNMLKLDIVDDDKIHEVKLSSKMKKADVMQLTYYLYYLRARGIEKEGELNYPKERRREKIKLEEQNVNELEAALLEIQQILKSNSPPKMEQSAICKKCAYYDFCMVGE